MKIITHDDIERLNISERQCLDWVIDALDKKNNCYLPPKCSIKPEKDVFFTSMPCLLPDLDVYGLKMVSRIPSQSPALNSTMMLFCYSTGELLAVMDCNWITAKRTGAVAALSIFKSARKGYSSIGCIGLGNTCQATLDILLNMDIERKLNLRLLKYKDHAQRLIQRYQNFSNVSFEIVESIEDLISNSDVILSCVTSIGQNIGEDIWFKEGCTVIPVHTMGFQNCDLFFDKVIIDDYEHVKNFKYYNQFKQVIELKDIIKGKSIRKNDNERIIAYNVGIALHDVYFAYKIYDLTKNNSKDVPFSKINNKYWI